MNSKDKLTKLLDINTRTELLTRAFTKFGTDVRNVRTKRSETTGKMQLWFETEDKSTHVIEEEPSDEWHDFLKHHNEEYTNGGDKQR